MKLLRDIATIRAGVPFRKKVEPVPSGRFRLVQIKDVDKAHRLLVDNLIRVEAKEARADHVLRAGDVLLVARGTRNHAAVFLADVGDAIAGAQLFIIRPVSSVLPEYLAWYLNEQAAQRHIAANLAGSFVPFVPKEALNKLRVPVPSMEEQRKIAAIHELALREQEILEDIKAKRRLLVESSLRQALKCYDNANHHLVTHGTDNEND